VDIRKILHSENVSVRVACYIRMADGKMGHWAADDEAHGDGGRKSSLAERANFIDRSQKAARPFFVGSTQRA